MTTHLLASTPVRTQSPSQVLKGFAGWLFAAVVPQIPLEPTPTLTGLDILARFGPDVHRAWKQAGTPELTDMQWQLVCLQK